MLSTRHSALRADVLDPNAREQTQEHVVVKKPEQGRFPLKKFCAQRNDLDHEMISGSPLFQNKKSRSGSNSVERYCLLLSIASLPAYYPLGRLYSLKGSFNLLVDSLVSFCR